MNCRVVKAAHSLPEYAHGRGAAGSCPIRVRAPVPGGYDMQRIGRRARWVPAGPIVAPLAGGLLAAWLAIAPLAPPARATFALRKGVFSGGGQVTTGGSYRLGMTVGETGVVGFVRNSSRALGAGFWPGQFWSVSGVPDAPVPAPTTPPLVNRLEANRPNPFQGVTSITFTVARPAAVRLLIFDVVGRHIATLADGPFLPGHYEVSWNGASDAGEALSNGIYFCRLDIAGWSRSQKLIKLR